MSKTQTTTALITEDGEVVEPVSGGKSDHSVRYKPFGQSAEIEIRWSDVEKWIQTRTKSGKSASPQDIVRFIKLCQSMGLNPWEGDCFLVGYDSQNGATFSLIVGYKALSKRAELNPQFDGIEAGCIVLTKNGTLVDRIGAFTLPDDELVGAWAKCWRKDRAHPYEARVKRAAFDKKRSRWRDDPEGMLLKCVKSQVIRELFPSTTSGLYISAELDAMEGGIKTVPQKQIASSDVNATLEGEPVPEREVVPETQKVAKAADKPAKAKPDATDEENDELLEECRALLAKADTTAKVDEVEEYFSSAPLSTAQQMGVSALILARKKEFTDAK